MTKELIDANAVLRRLYALRAAAKRRANRSMTVGRQEAFSEVLAYRTAEKTIKDEIAKAKWKRITEK